MDGELITAWTIRISLLAYFAALLCRLTGDAVATCRFTARLLWTAGCLCLLIHVACAFHFYHDWSHGRAFARTAADTKQQIGWSIGAGVYFNYIMIAVWSVDVAWWWIGPASYAGRPAIVSALLQGYLFFIAFNGAVVFETGSLRWIGTAATVILGILLVRRILGKKEGLIVEKTGYQ